MAKPSSAGDQRIRFQSLRKELGLLFLAAFYFVIATNTQSGWLLLMSAFLLGLLLISWFGPRRAIGQLKVQQRVLNQAQLGQTLNVEFQLCNLSNSKVREVLVRAPVQAWSESGPFRWLNSLVAPGGKSSEVYSLIPSRRGEHRLEGAYLVCGDPFGLFAVTREIEPTSSFLVYPKLELLPKDFGKSRLSGLLAQISAPRTRGDSRSVRSLREYQAGDDLRRIHWKSSSKLSGPGHNLLVCEYLAPAQEASTVVLDTSRRALPGDDLFEKSVSLVASVLWAAHRSGTGSSLWLRSPGGEWEKHTQWREQYRALAQVMLEPTLSFPAWNESLRVHSPLLESSSSIVLVTNSAPDFNPDRLDWASSVLVVTDSSTESTSSLPPTAILVDAKQPGFRELASRV